ncbi:zonular occludens toxin domain-containing protein [Iodobacter sp. CM08]|uniref:zonular occludens toxin domain-containing protein n=1 Tax=Iodobacter sp. CM08 TaxID=3085902 RepID=UPI0029829FB8|nr:zonular occludens toxin domain-containing protein [Iodobacter sp. CM08]MDW5415654.1 zonular occludens toxin domain-containing protein [Iodobacter sp. CM08]
MAINVYAGLQGSGKSFEVVSSVILEAILKGRRVVTNVAGINEDKIHEYLVNNKNAEPEALGSIIHVTNERISQACFFPDEEKPDLESVVKGGDLVAVDEAWRFWGTDNGKLSHEHMQYFRMHRHYVHPSTAVACDVVLMTQDVTGLHRSVKNVIEFTFRMQKHKSLGFSKRYRVDIYEGWKLNSKTRIDSRQKTYDPKIFPLYQSYTGGHGQETVIDKRQNIFGNKTLWAYAVFLIIFMSISGISAWRFFHPPSSEKPIALKNSPATPISSAPSPIQTEEKQLFSESWRVVGTFESYGERWSVVADNSGRLRVESPSVFHANDIAMTGEIDGERVTRFSGSPLKAGIQAEVTK